MSGDMVYSDGAEAYASSAGTGLTEIQDRFAMTPLYTKNHEFALPEEFMIDEETGEGAICDADGNVVKTSEIHRKTYHCNRFEEDLICRGMGLSTIYAIDFEEDVYTHRIVEVDANILEGNVSFISDTPITKAKMSLDISVLQSVAGTNVLHILDLDPIVKVDYIVSNTTKSFTCALSSLVDKDLEIDVASFKLTSLTISGTTTGLAEKLTSGEARILVHSILIAY